MAILIDPARWPAHGTRFAHLVSDESLAELHAFAQSNAVPFRAFDHDHYDIPAARTASLIEAGAVEVEARELVRRVAQAGLRVRGPDRQPRREVALRRLNEEWLRRLPAHPEVGPRLLARWQEPHRHYHDVRHLAHLLDALETINNRPPSLALWLAAWFHDAVYTGAAGADELASADLATAELSALELPSPLISEVERLILLTISHQPEPGDSDGAALVDADLAILGQVPGRYQVYLRGVRLEHPNLSDHHFGLARVGVVRALLGTEKLYGTPVGQRLWLNQARHNLVDELLRWQVVMGPDHLSEHP
jgi:predicted metal-dependent HD superfamily phosphohydrolase